MHITIAALGTRGDVQPILALGKGLQAAGHHVHIIAGSNFESWVRGFGFDFSPSLDMEAVMRSADGIAWAESSQNPFKQLGIMRRMLDDHGEQMVEPIVQSAASTDLLLSGFVSQPFVQSVSEKTGVRHITIALQPFRATRSGAAAMQPVLPKRDSLLNYGMGLFGEWLIWGVSRDTVNRLRSGQLNLPPHNYTSFRSAARPIPVIYGISRHVMPRAADWGVSVYQTGYWFLDEAQDWQPPDALRQFLESGSIPVYVGFGSMSSSDPATTVQTISEALSRSGQRGIIASGWSGADMTNLPAHVYLLDKAPHNWLFEQVAAVVHHGGAGTTAAGLRAGRPTMIVPHMSDQPYWGRRVQELGAGVKPVLRHKLNVDNLAAGIHELVTNTSITAAARHIGEQIRAEIGIQEAVAIIEKLANSH
ncbi:MAG: glycosyltransferase [Anaerolineae bacterium]